MYLYIECVSLLHIIVIVVAVAATAAEREKNPFFSFRWAASFFYSAHLDVFYFRMKNSTL